MNTNTTNMQNASVDGKNNDIIEMRTLALSIKNWEKMIARDEESKYAACINMDMQFHKLGEARKRLFEAVKNSPNIESPGEDVNEKSIADYVIVTLGMKQID